MVGRKSSFPITLVIGLYNSLYYRTSRDVTKYVSLSPVHTGDKLEFNTVDFVESRLLPKQIGNKVDCCCIRSTLLPMRSTLLPVCTGPKQHGRLSTKLTVLNSTLSRVCTGLTEILNWPLLLMTCCFKSDELTNYNYIERLVTRSLYTVSDCVMFQRVTLCILYTTS